MRLRNLNTLAKESKDKYLNEFKNNDMELPEQFKESFASTNVEPNGIIFSKYTAEIMSRTQKKIYLPNQWFYMATYMTEYVFELLKYRDEFYKIVSEYDTGIDDPKEFLNGKPKKLSDSLQQAISKYFNDGIDTECMINFLTDYKWWYGSKSIDRNDFYVSPVLNLLGVVNASQSYIAELANYYATVPVLRLESDTLKEQAALFSGVREKNDDRSAYKVKKTVKGGTNLIVYGAPGTGKSYYLENNAHVKKENVVRVTFHPEYTYQDFVGSYKPIPVYKQSDGTFTGQNTGEPYIDYRFVPGPFAVVLKQALSLPEEMHMLLIEELNRANASAVFGDLFQLLDRDQYGESVYRIKSDPHFLEYLGLGNIYIPSNLLIYATMNSSDQGVFVLDSAFKRRWNFKYMPIKIDATVPHKDELVKYGNTNLPWGQFLTAINNRLGQLNINEDKLIGPYFMKPSEPSIESNISSKLLIYLWDDVVRYYRNEFFISVNTFAELVHKYHSGEEIILGLELDGVKEEDEHSEDEE